MAESFLALFMVATLVEGIVEYLFSKYEKLEPFLAYIATGIAVIVCVLYGLDVLALLGLVTPVPFVGSVLTGFVIGRGSNYLNDFITGIKEPKLMFTSPLEDNAETRAVADAAVAAAPAQEKTAPKFVQN